MLKNSFLASAATVLEIKTIVDEYLNLRYKDMIEKIEIIDETLCFKIVTHVKNSYLAHILSGGEDIDSAIKVVASSCFPIGLFYKVEIKYIDE